MLTSSCEQINIWYQVLLSTDAMYDVMSNITWYCWHHGDKNSLNCPTWAEFEPTSDAPYHAFLGELWGIAQDYSGEKWPIKCLLYFFFSQLNVPYHNINS